MVSSDTLKVNILSIHEINKGFFTTKQIFYTINLLVIRETPAPQGSGAFGDGKIKNKNLGRQRRPTRSDGIRHLRRR